MWNESKMSRLSTRKFIPCMYLVFVIKHNSIIIIAQNKLHLILAIILTYRVHCALKFKKLFIELKELESSSLPKQVVFLPLPFSGCET